MSAAKKVVLDEVLETTTACKVDVPVMPSDAEIAAARKALGMRGKVKRSTTAEARTAKKWIGEPVSILGAA